MNLTELCAHLRNWFVRSESDKHYGVFEIANGVLLLPADVELRDGQYFRVIGSVFSDGVHQHPASFPTDETFGGEIWAMAVPSDVISLTEEISAWNDKYGAVVSSPFSSESFGGYTYTKSGGASVSGSSGVVTWQTQFRYQLNRWRKL